MNLKTFFIFGALLVAGSSFTHAQTLPAGCGDHAVNYSVKTQKSSTLPAPQEGMAQIVFIETHVGDMPAPTIRFAVDGAWLGATKGPSYAVFAVPAGAHAFCGSRQGSSKAEQANVSVLKAQVSAGTTYYYKFEITEVPLTSPTSYSSAPGESRGSMTARLAPTEDFVTLTEIPAATAVPLLKSLATSTQRGN